jgi:hypothetical protein
MASGAQDRVVGSPSLDKDAQLFSWLSGVDVAGARDGSCDCVHFTLLYLDANPSHVGVDVDRPACRLHRPTGCV